MSSISRLTTKEIKDLQRQKTKAQERGNLLEEAKLCNKLGDLFARCGKYNQAIIEHQSELQLSNSLDLPTDSGIAHRKLGECLCELGQYEKALEHQQQHLDLAKLSRDVKEQQRAYATIGRTWFVWSQGDQTVEAQTKLNEAERAYLESQGKCNELQGLVSEKELFSMKGRLFLNLGLVHEQQSRKKNVRKARKFLECALKLSHESGDCETEYRSQLSLASSFLHDSMVSYALRCYDAAEKIAKEQRNTTWEAEVYEGMGQAHVVTSNFKAAKKYFKLAFKKIGTSNSDEQRTLSVNLKRVRKAVKLERSLNATEGEAKEEAVNMWDKLGDLCAGLRTYQKAVDCYEKQLSLCRELGWTGHRIAPVLYSLARTHQDRRDFDHAIKYYKMEIEAQESKPKEQCSSWCWIGRSHVDANHSFNEVISAYCSALQCAKDANSLKQQCDVIQQMISLYEKEGDKEKSTELEGELRKLEIKQGTAEEWSQETDEASEIMDTDPSEDEESDGETMSSDSDTVDEETGTRKSRRVNSVKIDKVNAKGETLLHQGCIANNMRLVQTLLAEGATVRCRDYCGWTPLHEAANHGYCDIALLLLQNGANVNDPGGLSCDGITPLHDAAINGHIDVVKLLVDYGADLFLQNAKGMTALELVKDQLDSDDEDDDDDEADGDQIFSRRRAVCQYLTEKVEAFSPLNKRSRKEVDSVVGYDTDDSPPHSANRSRAKKVGERKSRHSSKKRRNDFDSDSDSMEIVVTNGSKNYELPVVHTDECEVLCDSPDKESSEMESVLPLRGSNMETSCFDVNLLNASNEIAKAQDMVEVPALLPESDGSDQQAGTDDNWLIDDIGPNVKRRRTNKSATPRKARVSRKRTSDNMRTGEQHDNYNLVTDSARGSTETLVNAQTRPKRSSHNIVDGSSSHNVSPMRVKVSVMGKVFVIPCPSIEENESLHGPKIEWVASEAASRYYAMSGLMPRLTLKTREGALFDPNDCVTNVLVNNEELIGHVESWNLPPLSDRYLKACTSVGQEICPHILRVIESDADPTEIMLQDQLISPEISVPFFRALQCQLSLSKLFLSGNQIGNTGFVQLGVSLCTLPNMAHLDVSLNNITYEGLTGFVEQLIERNAGEFGGVSTAGQPLDKLCDLNLSYNSLGDESAHSLTKLLNLCVSLSCLTIDGCRFTNNFSSGLRMYHKQGIQKLSVAHNELGGAGVQSLLQTISSACLKLINLSCCNSADHSIHARFSTSITETFLFETSLHLETVILSGCHLTDIDCDILEPFLSSNPLQQLILSANNLGPNAGHVLARVINSCRSLKVLNIAGNPAFGNEGIRVLLSVAAARLEVLDISGCGLTSPLPHEVVSLDSLLQSESICLRRLLLSNNNLTEEDRSTMGEAWKLLWGENGMLCTNDDFHFTLAVAGNRETVGNENVGNK